MRRALLPLVCLVLAACGDAGGQGVPDAAVLGSDPVVARALHDPLMSDPDLASRNEANAVIGFAEPGAVPLLAATPRAANAAREAARLELLEGGTIPDLPLPQSQPRGQALGPAASAVQLLEALGASRSCAAALRQDFALAATLPPVAAIMPHGMVTQAAAADTAACRIRIIRYLTPAPVADVLEYHHAHAVRAGLYPLRHTQPEDIIAASGVSGETLVVHVRPAANGLISVDLLYRAI
jgi:hypothetical protein